jgi:NADH-quinone oxidoreductase subunit L
MNETLIWIALSMALLPLGGALLAGLLGKKIGRKATHRSLIFLLSIAFLFSLYLFRVIVLKNHPTVEQTFYVWGTAGIYEFDIAFLLDKLSVTMSLIVLFVSLMVNIYTIGYMAEDPGYQRFFSYMSLFTFAMLILVLANNFLLLFFGWEGVGLVSYLLIGFWFNKEPAILGSLKAFLVNRVGDMGFILAMASILMYFGTLNYRDVFVQVPGFVQQTREIFPGVPLSIVSVICFFLLISAMAKSAQVPLHVWLPESMEGPTPISALIHAATMVTAGIYMIARMSPIFEYSQAVLTLVLIVGGTTALLMGLVAIVQNDIKRVIAYSTISQLGYMVVALGASAYDAAIFHLMTHAFFKALLFLAAGSVIIAMHHEQDMRKMGGLARYLPVTYLTFMIGALALCAIPPFAGFYSKDVIIEAVKLSHLPGAGYAYFCVLIGAFVTPLYTFRAIFMTFHTKPRMDEEIKNHLHESPWVMLMPLVALAVPSIMIGSILVGPMIFAHFPLLGNSIFVLPEHAVLNQLSLDYRGANHMWLTAGEHVTFWLAISGIITAWLFTAMVPAWSKVIKKRAALLDFILRHQYGFDAFNQKVLVKGIQKISHLFYDVTDVKLIDGIIVNGSGRLIRVVAQVSRLMQTGYIYHYAFVMILGLAAGLAWYLGGF